jgi:hypothetical protein
MDLHPRPLNSNFGNSAGKVGMAQNEASPYMRIALGTALGIGGLGIAIVNFRKLLLAAHPLQDETMSFSLLGLCILFFGATISLPNVVGFRQRLFLGLAVTWMALLFDWIAFLPGAREFNVGSSASHPGGRMNSTFGRVVFGVVAVLMDVFAFYVWRLAIRLLRTGSETKK